jgi:hypothetical protein
MKPEHLLAPLVALSVITALVGCTSTNRQVSASSFDEGTLQRDAAPVSSEFTQSVFPNALVLRKLDLYTNGPVTLDGGPQLDASATANKDFRALYENGHAQIHATEFLTQTPKGSRRYHFFGDPERTNKDYSSWDKEELQPEGLQLFSIHF